jgi:hypothetical protein
LCELGAWGGNGGVGWNGRWGGKIINAYEVVEQQMSRWRGVGTSRTHRRQWSVMVPATVNLTSNWVPGPGDGMGYFRMAGICSCAGRLFCCKLFLSIILPT